MGSRQITRKEFLKASFAGVAGLSLVKGHPEGQLHQAQRVIGRTGIRVSPVCFGAPRTSELSLIRYAISKGINFIDTGRAYGNGNNEILVGNAVEGMRDKVVIQTKIRLEYNELPSMGKGRKGAAEIKDVLSGKLSESLKALKSSFVDVLLYHDAIDEDLLFHEATMEFFDSSKKAGLIRAHGFSTHSDRMKLIDRNISDSFYDVIMVPFNHKGSYTHSLTGQYSEWDADKLTGLLSESGRKGTGVISMKTCSGGKYQAATNAEPNYREAVRWVLQHNFVSSAAVAMANFEQVDDFLPLLG